MSAKEDKSPTCNLSVPSKQDDKNQAGVQVSDADEGKSVFSLKSSPLTYKHIYFKTASSPDNGPTVKQERSQNLVFKTSVNLYFLPELMNVKSRKKEKEKRKTLILYSIIKFKVQL